MQRSRANWLKHGDRNTSFFHHFATARKKRNAIKKLKDNDGNRKEGDVQVGALAVDYFKELFSAEVYAPNLDVLEKVKPRVTEYMNDL